ncbi:uncharacterized protein LOC133203990 [Saccostrea echinata]|uniref:uncharacterized protein LOC133203990 n=1 Tax=Saccostrea echinata TaxID=191078 RepID=UPI002A82388F|nr:uncharacterized protein LOC133203990 [Saccostrea echinata]
MVCACCLKSSNAFVVDEDDSKITVFACPECVRCFREFSSWTTPQTLINTLAEVFYCMQCCKQEAHYRGKCGHLFCLQCLQRIDSKSNQRTCNVLGCTTIISNTEVDACYKEIQAIEMWKSLELPKIQECQFPCKQKVVLALKPCGHGFCYSCIQTKLKNNIETRHTLSGKKVFRCTGTLCQTTIKESILEDYLYNLSRSVLSVTFILEISTKECFKCKNNSKSEAGLTNIYVF